MNLNKIVEIQLQKKPNNWLRFAIVGINLVAMWLVLVSKMNSVFKMKWLDFLMQLSILLIIWLFAIMPTVRHWYEKRNKNGN